MGEFQQLIIIGSEPFPVSRNPDDLSAFTYLIMAFNPDVTRAGLYEHDPCMRGSRANSEPGPGGCFVKSYRKN